MTHLTQHLVSHLCLPIGANYLDGLVLPLGLALTGSPSTTVCTVSTQQTHPTSVWDVLKANAESVVTTITLVTEHHLVFIMRLVTVHTRLTVIRNDSNQLE